MKLTGKLKIAFEKWYKDQDFKISYITDQDGDKMYWNLEVDEEFKALPDSMKWGVYVDFAESVGIVIDIQPVLNYDKNVYTEIEEFLIHLNPLNTEDYTDDYAAEQTRPEARTKAVEAFDKMYNDLHKK